MSHTPGPWEIDTAKDRDGRYHIVNGRLPKGINPEFGYPVCDSSNRHHCITPQEDAANARLIAAAPELLEALKVASRLLFLYLPTDEGYGLPAAKERIHAAIAKATGGAQ